MTPRLFDEEAVLAKLAVVRERLDLLGRLGDVDAQRLETDLAARVIVERVVTHVVELAASINSHVSTTQLGTAPHDYRSSFALAARAGLIDGDLAARLAPSAGLRNLVVHEYLGVDLGLLAEAVPMAIEQYREYVSQVAGWLDARR